MNIYLFRLYVYINDMNFMKMILGFGLVKGPFIKPTSGSSFSNTVFGKSKRISCLPLIETTDKQLHLGLPQEEILHPRHVHPVPSRGCHPGQIMFRLFPGK